MRIERFEIKEEHLKLLNRAYVTWHRCECGSPTIDPKRPYGNSFVEGEIIEILGWKLEVDEEGEISEKQYKDAMTIHNETETALQICLKLLKFEVGVYENIGYGINWKKIS